VVETVEVGPRDGLQNEPTLLSMDQKVELLGRAVAVGTGAVGTTRALGRKIDGRCVWSYTQGSAERSRQAL
jgi:hypothetical protein